MKYLRPQTNKRHIIEGLKESESHYMVSLSEHSLGPIYAFISRLHDISSKATTSQPDSNLPYEFGVGYRILSV